MLFRSFRVRGPEILRFALEWGEHCEVIGPPDLRRDVRAALAAASAHYDDPASPEDPP